MKRKAFYGAAVCLFAVAASLSTGCAVMMKGGKSKRFSVVTDPPAAEVYLDGNLSGTTPCELALTLKKNHLIEFRKESFENETILVSKHRGANWVIADIALGIPAVTLMYGLFHGGRDFDYWSFVFWIFEGVPALVDANTGAWNHFDRNKLEVTLKKEK